VQNQRPRSAHMPTSGGSSRRPCRRSSARRRCTIPPSASSPIGAGPLFSPPSMRAASRGRTRSPGPRHLTPAWSQRRNARNTRARPTATTVALSKHPTEIAKHRTAAAQPCRHPDTNVVPERHRLAIVARCRRHISERNRRYHMSSRVRSRSATSTRNPRHRANSRDRKHPEANLPHPASMGKRSRSVAIARRHPRRMTDTIDSDGRQRRGGSAKKRRPSGRLVRDRAWNSRGIEILVPRLQRIGVAPQQGP